MRVAVIGLGVAGAAVSVLLKRMGGHSVEIFEKFPRARPIGSGILLQMTGMSVLDRLGALDHVLQHGAVVERLYGTTDKSWWSMNGSNNSSNSNKQVSNSPRDRVVLDLIYKEYKESFFGLGVHRSTLFDSLYHQVCTEEIPVHFDTHITGTTIKRSSQSNTGQVSGASVRDLFCEKHQKYHGSFDLVINCTGTHSQLLRHMGDEEHDDDGTVVNKHRNVSPYNYGSLWTTCPDTHDEYTSQRVLVQKYRDASHMSGIMPCGRMSHTDENLVSVFWSLRRDHAREFLDPNLSLDEWKERLTTYWKALAPLMDTIQTKDQFVYAQYNDVRMKRKHFENLVYIGDVCHGTSPQLGQGANLALVDALVLSQLFSSQQASNTWSNVDIATQIDRFHKMRHSHVQYYQIASAWLTPFFQSNSKVAAFARDHLLGISCKIPPLQWWMSRTLSGIQTMNGTLDLDVSNVIRKRELLLNKR